MFSRRIQVVPSRSLHCPSHMSRTSRSASASSVLRSANMIPGSARFCYQTFCLQAGTRCARICPLALKFTMLLKVMMRKQSIPLPPNHKDSHSQTALANRVSLHTSKSKQRQYEYSYKQYWPMEIIGAWLATCKDLSTSQCVITRIQNLAMSRAYRFLLFTEPSNMSKLKQEMLWRRTLLADFCGE